VPDTTIVSHGLEATTVIAQKDYSWQISSPAIVGELEEEDDPFPPLQPKHRLVTNLQELTETLYERSYPGLDLTTKVFEGETHHSVVPGGYGRGLRALFK
jgi:hypothetical protein